MEILKSQISRDHIEYPESDGKPMAETGLHVKALATLYQELTRYFEKDDDVMVFANMFLYFVEGKPKKCMAPDVFVLRGTTKYERRVFKVWEEGRMPQMVMEITSDKTIEEDEVAKAKRYLALGVEEYFQFDPTEDYIPGRLKGRYSKDGEWHPIDRMVVPGAKRAYPSRSLGLAFVVDENNEIRLWDMKKKQMVKNPSELAKQARDERAAREAAEKLAAEAQATNKALAQRVKELEALLGK